MKRKSKKSTWHLTLSKGLFFTSIILFFSIALGALYIYNLDDVYEVSIIFDDAFKASIFDDFFGDDFNDDFGDDLGDNLGDDMYLPENFDPLKSNKQCSTTNQTALSITGGSGLNHYSFKGSGIDGLYGILSDGENSIDSTNETLTTSSIVTYTAPKTNNLTQLGQIFVEVEDDLVVDDTGNKQKVVFTIDITPSCIRLLEIIKPSEKDENTISKGVPFRFDVIRAILFNNDIIDYPLPQDDIEFAVRPTDSGYFEGGRYFYTTLNGGEAHVVAYIPSSSNASSSGSFVGTDTYSFDVEKQKCVLKANFYTGRGSGFQDGIPTDVSPVTRSPALHSGENIVLFAEDGKDKYLFSSSDTGIVTIYPYIPGQSIEESTDAIDSAEEGFVPDPVYSEFAIVKAVSSGVATLFITDENLCTAILTVYVDSFPPNIEYATFTGGEGLAKSGTKVLHLRVSDLDGTDDIYEIEFQLYKRWYPYPKNISANAQPLLNKNLIVKDLEDETQDTETLRYTRSYKVDITIPDLVQITDGYYTLLTTVSDLRQRDYGYNKTSKTTRLYIGRGIPGDFNDDGEVNEIDVIRALQNLARPETSDKKITISDIITLLQILNQ